MSQSDTAQLRQSNNMRSELSFWVCFGAVLVLACLVHCKRGRKANRCGKSAVNTTYHRSARHLRRGFQVSCQKDEVIAHLEVAGHNGSCRGLTPDLFVQTNLCLWKQQCTLRYVRKRGVYMLKVLAGPRPECAAKEAKHFTISYGCARAGVTRQDVINEGPMSEMGFSTEGRLERAVPPERRGLVRSHGDFPWHYTPPLRIRSQSYTLTLLRPSENASYFVYTIRTMKISHSDTLTVSGSGGPREVPKNQTSTSTYVMDGSGDVTFTLNTTFDSPGGEGFFLCFQWQNNNTPSDACEGIIIPKHCDLKRKKNKGNGKNGSKGTNGRRRNRSKQGRGNKRRGKNQRRQRNNRKRGQKNQTTQASS